MLDDVPREDVVSAVDAMVGELLESAGVTQPPVDAIRLAQGQLDMVICLDERQNQRGRAQRILGKQQTYLCPESREERHQWTVAHEIGEHFKSELLERLGVEPANAGAMMGESLANLFAYHLLVPARWFGEDARCLDFDLLALKQRYATSSHEVIAWRFLDLPVPCAVTIIDNERVQRRRSNAGHSQRQLAPAEQRCWRQVSEQGQPVVVRDDDCTVHGWPVHELEWKREILRAVRTTDEVFA